MMKSGTTTVAVRRPLGVHPPLPMPNIIECVDSVPLLLVVNEMSLSDTVDLDMGF